jgi:RNA polymerase sigma factor (sigma-70 family)
VRVQAGAMATLADNEQQRRNAELIDQLIRTELRTLRRQATRHASDPEEIEDILQRAYELFIERYAPPYEPLPWLMTTIKREAWSRPRLVHSRREIPISTEQSPGDGGYDLAECIPDPGRGPEETATERLRDEELRAEVRELKPDERTALGLFALGYSYAEIAAAKGWTYTKVNRCVSEGRATLRSRLGES